MPSRHSFPCLNNHQHAFLVYLNITEDLNVTGLAVLPEIDTLHLLTMRHGSNPSCTDFCEEQLKNGVCIEGRNFGAWDTNANPTNCAGWSPMCLCSGIVAKWNDI